MEQFEIITPEGKPQKGSPVKWILLGCGSFILLGIVVFAGLWFFVKKATRGPEEVVRHFLEAAGRSDYRAAYDTFSVPLKQAQSFDEFREVVEKNLYLFQVTDIAFRSRSIDQDGAQFECSLTLESGTQIKGSFKLVKEKTEWKLIAYHLGT